jgi:hypothetical protein
MVGRVVAGRRKTPQRFGQADSPQGDATTGGVRGSAGEATDRSTCGSAQT